MVWRDCGLDFILSQGYRGDSGWQPQNKEARAALHQVSPRTQNRFHSLKGLAVQFPEGTVWEPRSKLQQGLEGKGVFDKPAHGGSDRGAQGISDLKGDLVQVGLHVPQACVKHVVHL